MLKFDRKQQNSVKQLSFNKKKINFFKKGMKYWYTQQCVYMILKSIMLRESSQKPKGDILYDSIYMKYPE